MASPSSIANPKDLKFIFTLGASRGTFSSNGQNNNTLIVQGLKASVHIDNAGGAMMGTLRAQIFGMSESNMNTLTSLMWEYMTIRPQSAVQVFAVDGAKESLIYNGVIMNCWAVFSQIPDAYLLIEGQLGYSQLMQSSSPTSLSVDTTVGDLMRSLVSKMGFQFENNGVDGATVQTVVAKGTYLGGTLMEQARTLMWNYRFWMYIDNTNPNTLAIVPANVARIGITPLISAATGMIGYPLFSSSGVNFETLFNPDIMFGGTVKIQSAMPKANQTWIVVSMAHDLSSQTPGGPWKTVVSAVSQTILTGGA